MKFQTFFFFTLLEFFWNLLIFSQNTVIFRNNSVFLNLQHGYLTKRNFVCLFTLLQFFLESTQIFTKYPIFSKIWQYGYQTMRKSRYFVHPNFEYFGSFFFKYSKYPNFAENTNRSENSFPRYRFSNNHMPVVYNQPSKLF